MMEKLIVRELWKDTKKPVKHYGIVIRGELVFEDENDFAILTEKFGKIICPKNNFEYQIIKKVIQQ